MKKIITLGLLALGTNSYAFDGYVEMPSEEELYRRICNVITDDFVEKTNIHRFLSDRRLHVCILDYEVGSALLDYCRSFENPRKASVFSGKKPIIVKSILEDQPSAIHDLRDRGYDY